MNFHAVANIFPMMSDEEYLALVEDIIAHGQHEPIWIYDGQIIDGRNRWRACKAVGITPITRDWDGNGSLVSFVVSLNLKRRHLTSSQKAIIALDVEKELADEAAQKETARKQQQNETTLQIFAKSESVHAAEHAAAIVGTNHTYVSAAKKIAQNAPDLIDAIRNGTITIPEARALSAQSIDVRTAALDRRINGHAKSAHQAIRESIAYDFGGMLPAPAQRYHAIVIDPPWPMQKIARDVRPNQSVMDYPTMTLEDISAFDLSRFAADDCHLYLWTTHKYLPDAMRLAEHWGFRYQCLMTWTKNVGPTPFSWMYSTEHVLFCRKGDLELLQLGRRLDFAAPVREHSRKPDVFYDLVRDVSPGPRIDIFAREPHDGFETWGNEVDLFAEAI